MTSVIDEAPPASPGVLPPPQPPVKPSMFGDWMASRLRDFGYRGLLYSGVVIAALSLWAIFFGGGGLSLWWRRLLEALANGFVYGVIALALVLIYKATGIINFAQGQMAMFGTFLAYVLSREQSWPVWLSIIVATAISAVFGAVFERVFIRPFDPANHLPIIMVTIALGLMIDGLAIIIWAVNPRTFPTPFPSVIKSDWVNIFGFKLYYTTLGIWVSVIVLTLIVSVLLTKTKIGLSFRAVSSNLESSRLVGINVGKTLQFGWALAAAIGTLAGCLLLSDGRTFLEPPFMAKALIFAFAAATIGGFDSLGGALVGGIAVGELQTMIGGYVRFIGTDLTLAFTLVVIIVVLLVRPNGLFGKVRVERV